MNAQGEKLLQELLNKEQSLIVELETSKLQAEKMLKEAQLEAQNTLTGAKAEVEKLSADLAAKTKVNSDELQASILNLAEKEVAEINTKAKSRFQTAVELVMERITP